MARLTVSKHQLQYKKPNSELFDIKALAEAINNLVSVQINRSKINGEPEPGNIQLTGCFVRPPLQSRRSFAVIQNLKLNILIKYDPN